MNTPDLHAATEAVAVARAVCRQAAAHLAELSGEDGRISVAKLDRHQVLAYDLAHATAGVEGAAVMVEYGAHGGLQARLACLFTAEAIADLVGRLVGREAEWGVSAADLSPAGEFVAAHRAPEFLEDVAEEVARHGGGPAHLAEEFELVRDTFHRFAADKVRPVAEEVHRKNSDIPEEVIGGLAEIGGFGLSVPEEYGGFAAGGESDYLGMVIATEELSWGSLGVGGSLITRPEILTRALVRGGTEEQKKVWLPKIAAGEAMVGVMVTEPDYGSDVASLKVSATPTEGARGSGGVPQKGWRINGVKTWATFAGRANTLMLLARTDPDKSKGHKGLSLFIVEKPEAPGHHFEFRQDANPDGSSGRMEGRAIDTLGYRGMHSYEVSFEDWFVPAANLIGGEGGLGKGFYYQMEGFENGRLQTAARAVGLMQAAYDAALDYARERRVFDKSIFEYQLTKAKIARMAAVIQGGRQFAYTVARLMAKGEGALEASMVKAYVCRAAEWVTREALQIHGGMGYAEEFPVSRYFVDARVLSIFEGADETLCLRLIARRLAEQPRPA
ncbi:MAG TPA: acyl-CoA dehydrogenase family protein [Acidimicrobiia bacterium]|nr:acyl-CoA dehydrogenase family protein [Acidimicrobiia bacterium]